MTGDEFLKLARRLRDMGAVHVKAGELEVAFGPTPILPVEDEDLPVAGSGSIGAVDWFREQYGSSV